MISEIIERANICNVCSNEGAYISNACKIFLLNELEELIRDEGVSINSLFDETLNMILSNTTIVTTLNESSSINLDFYPELYIIGKISSRMSLPDPELSIKLEQQGKRIIRM